MLDEMLPPQEDTYEPPQFTLPAQAGILSGAFAFTSLFDFAVHGGPAGLILAGGISACALKAAPLVYPWFQDRHIEWQRAVQERRMKRLEQEGAYDEQHSEPEPLVPILPRPVAQPEAPVVTDILPESATGRVFPASSRNKTLYLGQEVATGRRVDPPMNGLLGKGLLLAGSQGTGKSNIIGLVVQSAGDCGATQKKGMPVVVIDYKGEFHTLRHVVPNGMIAGHPDEMAPDAFALTEESAPKLAKMIMEGPLQVIVDVPSYNGDNDEVAHVVSALLHALMDWSRAIRRAEQEPWPCLVITDEAHNFLPQAQRLSALAMKKPAESFGLLTSAYSRMANTGRSFGYTLVLATQRLPNIAKWAIANLQIKVVLAHAEKNDLDACEEETGGLVDREEIKTLKQGTGIVVNLTKEPMIVHFDRQKAEHVSNTPDVERLHAHFQDEQPAPQREQPKQAPSYTPPAQGNREMSIDTILELYRRQKISEEVMFRLIEQLPSVRSDDDAEVEERQEAPYRSSMPAGKLVLPGAQPPSYAAPTQRMVPRAPMREQHGWTPPTTPRGHLQAVPKMDDLPGQVVEQSKHFSSGLSSELQAAYDAFQPGMSNRDLGRVLDVAHTTAGRLIQRLVDKGAISPDRQRKLLAG